MCTGKPKFHLISLVVYSLYFGGQDTNPQYLQGMHLINFNFNLSSTILLQESFVSTKQIILLSLSTQILLTAFVKRLLLVSYPRLHSNSSPYLLHNAFLWCSGSLSSSLTSNFLIFQKILYYPYQSYLTCFIISYFSPYK